ncbi:MAG: hypothetical protein ACI9TH_004959, partial [Kiritimatiellia bacterium]
DKEQQEDRQRGKAPAETFPTGQGLSGKCAVTPDAQATQQDRSQVDFFDVCL